MTAATEAGRRLIADVEKLEPPASLLATAGHSGRMEWATWHRALLGLVRSGVVLAEIEAAKRPERLP